MCLCRGGQWRVCRPLPRSLTASSTGTREGPGSLRPLDPATGEPRQDQLLLVASDRISAYDVILDTPIPDKGRSSPSSPRGGSTSSPTSSPTTSSPPTSPPPSPAAPSSSARCGCSRRVRGRAYLTGGGLAEYLATGTVSGVASRPASPTARGCPRPSSPPRQAPPPVSTTNPSGMPPSSTSSARQPRRGPPS